LSAPKFKTLWKKGKQTTEYDTSNNLQDRAIIAQLKNEIEKKLRDESNAKKAALIISKLLNDHKNR